MDTISVENLSKHYKDVIAVDNISFNVKKGGCFGLLGPNGAGKTTTIEIMEDIIKPTNGKVQFHNKNSKQVSELIGIQFQHTALQDYLTGKETIELFSSFYQHTLDPETLIDLCDLRDFINRDTRLLSGGQRQRLLLALALINDPEIIFLDEPTTGLDPQSRRHFWQLIDKIKKQNKTIILTTHYMDEAQQLCDDLVIMDRGKIIEQGTPKQLLAKHFKDVFISLPIGNVNNQLVNKYGWQQHGDYIEIKTASVEDTLKQLIELDIALTGLHVKSANLDDLFLKLTGHSLTSDSSTESS